MFVSLNFSMNFLRRCDGRNTQENKYTTKKNLLLVPTHPSNGGGRVGQIVVWFDFRFITIPFNVDANTLFHFTLQFRSGRESKCGCQRHIIHIVRFEFGSSGRERLGLFLARHLDLETGKVKRHVARLVSVAGRGIERIHDVSVC